MAMDGVDGVEEQWVEANGIRFQVATMPPRGGGESDKLALCLHGFPECWYSWRAQMPLLAARGYRVWAPNLRGYGHTDRPKGIGAYAVETLMDDVAALIDASGARTTLLLSHDWGAIIAWYFAMRRLRELEGLVVLNVPHPGCWKNGGWKQLRKSWYGLFFQLPWLPEKLIGARPVGRLFAETSVHPERFDAEVQRVYTDNARIPGALTGMINYYRALLRGGGGRRQQRLGFPVIDTRTLMIWGEQDLALTVETTHGTDDFVRDLTLRRLPDASHWVQQDVPETVNELLDAWLDRRGVPAA